MKIVTGQFKGRNIKVPMGIRPLSLRVKEACFNILGKEIEERSILDLFAGSGSLGLEAISRGAAQAVFIDSSSRSISAVRDNIESFSLRAKAQAYLKDALDAISGFQRQKVRFDLVFLDPPYHKGLLIKALQQLQEYDILTPSGYLVGFASVKDGFMQDSRFFSLIVDKKYGQTRLLVYRKT